MLELLSPAGSPEAVVAAVQNGADAIYLGLGGFNARRGAKNFTRQEFLEAVKYCCARGCRVYVTMNTLASDRELEAVAEMGRFVSDAGADAVLVQDLGVARVLRAVCPDLPLHASTQMSIHNLAGVHAAAQMGLSRAVLARELTWEQIRFIASHAPIEVEVFVHGALCFCHSGQCYLSALIGRRSGNRGACAQPCRMQYGMGRRAEDYPLSLKDNCLVMHLRELEEMGVRCVKIEGRMKRPEYTAITTRIYHRAITEGIPPTERDMETLKLAFSRDGFTDGYYTGEKQEMHGVRGEAAERESVNRLFAETRRAYSNGELRRVGVDFQIEVRRARSASLTASDSDGNRVTVLGPVPAQAVSAALTQEGVSAQLYKTGGTQFHCRTVTGFIDSGQFLSAADINAMRRAVLRDLSEQRAAPPRRRSGLPPRPPRTMAPAGRMLLNVQVLGAAQLTPELAAVAPDRVYVPLPVLAEEPDAVRPFMEAGIAVAAVLPRVITDTELKQVAALLKTVREQGVQEALCGNIGHIALAKAADFVVRGDFGLNVFNVQTLRVLADAQLASATASFELRLAQVRDMAKCLDTELILYGRLPCMVSDQDILRRAAGESAALSDRMGSVFPVMKEFGCRTVIYNAHKLFLADRLPDVAACGLWAGRLMFTTESPRECVEVTKSYRGLSDYRPNGLTRGLYYRGVE
ncbi:MAG: U32 family peptidase [Oscillospiraceae bacterium]|nr:U32 family peptidase [Oscillospiraceae bacterium]